MSKNKKNNAKEVSELAPIEKSDEILTVKVAEKPAKQDKAAKQAKDAKNKKKAKANKPKRNFFKEIISELKKVSWPTFKQALKQTGTVLVVVGVFMVVVLGIDEFLSLLVWLVVGK